MWILSAGGLTIHLPVEMASVSESLLATVAAATTAAIVVLVLLEETVSYRKLGSRVTASRIKVGWQSGRIGGGPFGRSGKSSSMT